ncbi:MAG: 4Fe-4S binding protein [Spirochaetes bacterium]|nr:4Fe-4S binding protein [Spirochaetota bacterium]
MITKKYFLYFPRSETEKPLVYHLVKDYDLVINIFRAKVTPDEEGYLILDITGTEENIAQGIAYIKTLNVTVNETVRGLRWDEDKCVSCTNCIVHCPTKALYIADQKTKRIAFDEEKCIECLSCVKNCPFNACTSVF